MSCIFDKAPDTLVFICNQSRVETLDCMLRLAKQVHMKYGRCSRRIIILRVCTTYRADVEEVRQVSLQEGLRPWVRTPRPPSQGRQGCMQSS